MDSNPQTDKLASTAARRASQFTSTIFNLIYGGERGWEVMNDPLFEEFLKVASSAIKDRHNQPRFENIERRVLEWANEKSLLGTNSLGILKQTLKFASESGELCDAIGNEDEEEIIDAIGDVMVTLIILCRKKRLDLPACITTAYNVIENRTGKTVNGTFIKDA